MNQAAAHNRSNELSLVTRLCRGDKGAMAELYDRYGKALLGIAYRVVGSQETAEDLLQNAFLQIWAKIDTFDIERGTLFTWMARIVRNGAIDHIRSKAHRNEQKNYSLEKSVDIVEQLNPVSYNPDVIGLNERVEKLDPELREVIRALYFLGSTHKEAAEELGIPIGTIKTRARRAVLVLRGWMNEPKEGIDKE